MSEVPLYAQEQAILFEGRRQRGHDVGLIFVRFTTMVQELLEIKDTQRPMTLR